MTEIDGAVEAGETKTVPPVYNKSKSRSKRKSEGKNKVINYI